MPNCPPISSQVTSTFDLSNPTGCFKVCTNLETLASFLVQSLRRKADNTQRLSLYHCLHFITTIISFSIFILCLLQLTQTNCSLLT